MAATDRGYRRRDVLCGVRPCIGLTRGANQINSITCVLVVLKTT